MWFKKKAVPTNEKIETKACVQLWHVRWESRNGIYAGCVQPEMEAFTSEKESRDFKQSLLDAFKLIKHTSGTEVTFEKAE